MRNSFEVHAKMIRDVLSKSEEEIILQFENYLKKWNLDYENELKKQEKIILEIQNEIAMNAAEDILNAQ